MERWHGRVAVVTGASAGIGAALCQDLVEQGMVVVGLARREEWLKEMKNKLREKSKNLHFVKTDLTKDEEIKAAFKWITENFGGVDVFINNAGTNTRGYIWEVKPEDYHRVYDVNVLALMTCTQEAIKSMIARNVNGHVIIINSIASFRTPFPTGSVYNSSKHASKILTEGLRRDLVAEKSKIKVTSVSPGVVDTDMFRACNIKLNVSERPHLKPKDVAEGIRYVLSTPPEVEVTEFTIRAVGCFDL